MTKTNDPGVRMIPVYWQYHVWTKKVGHGPINLLLLHGGPGLTHEYFKNFGQWLSPDEYTVYYYDQLGSFYSDQPDDPALWTIERFREEIEPVRVALGLEAFYLYGHSWGGTLGLEYALKYQQHLRGLIVSNMTASDASYETYLGELNDRLSAEDVATMKRHEGAGDLEDPDYQTLLASLFNYRHVCRIVPWPEPVQRTFYHQAVPVNTTINENSKDWNRWDDLQRITVPTLLSVGRHDIMNPAEVKEMGRRMPAARVSICKNGSHFSMWDDAETYFQALKQFLNNVERGTFQTGEKGA